MVRTKAGSVSTKAVGAKAPQKVAITAILSGNAAKGRNHSGGNSYHPRETPGWQKPITFFMKGGESSRDVSKEKEEEEDILPGIVATKSSKEVFQMDMDVEESEKVEANKKQIEIEKPGNPKKMKKEEAKKDETKMSEDSKEDEKEEEEEEEEEDQGIPGITASNSPNKKILESHDNVEVEKAVDAETVKEKVKKEDFEEIEKERKANEDMEVEKAVDAETLKEKIKKEDFKEIEKEGKANKDEGEDKENEFKKVDTKTKKDPESIEDAGETKEI